MNQLTTVELVLLQIIAESERMSGYEINKLIELRGYREWTKIGTTSIYAGLQKLKEKRLIRSDNSDDKIGKGPLPVKFTITENGQQILHNEIIDCLSSTRERDSRFDLGLAALPFIHKEEAKEALRKRYDFLQETSLQLEGKYKAQGGKKLPMHVRALFLHPLSLIDKELQFIDQLISELEGETAK
ncbi:PadR family transcriptional regulator [Paenibacillus sp. FSL E2-8871]|uniref:PadR family transcriptional regulator n=1 Tax=Paenibacillus sp. FSL E2-8871 TaxID=2975326 RepID=UPI0030FC06B3